MKVTNYENDNHNNNINDNRDISGNNNDCGCSIITKISSFKKYELNDLFFTSKIQKLHFKNWSVLKSNYKVNVFKCDALTKLSSHLSSIFIDVVYKFIYVKWY